MSQSSYSRYRAHDTERRAARRRRVLKGSRLTMADGRPLSSATLRDISETGARLSLLNVLSVPGRFHMMVEIDGMNAECEVVWRKPGQIGVRFLSRPRYETPLRRQVIQPASPTGLHKT